MKIVNRGPQAEYLGKNHPLVPTPLGIYRCLWFVVKWGVICVVRHMYFSSILLVSVDEAASTACACASTSLEETTLTLLF